MKALSILLILLVTKTASAWWCFNASPYRLTVCTTNYSESKNYKTVWYQPKAACFSFFDVMANKQSEWCSANFGDCENIHDRYVIHNKDFRVTSACYAKGSN